MPTDVFPTDETLLLWKLLHVYEHSDKIMMKQHNRPNSETTFKINYFSPFPCIMLEIANPLCMNYYYTIRENILQEGKITCVYVGYRVVHCIMVFFMTCMFMYIHVY